LTTALDQVERCHGGVSWSCWERERGIGSIELRGRGKERERERDGEGAISDIPQAVGSRQLFS
jgi:hypothetical protein